jgi:DNA-binding SARP family transcriptional activator
LLGFRILGPLEVAGEAGALRLGGPKRRAVLAILLLNANRVVSIDRLADDLYGDATPASAVTQMQTHLAAAQDARPRSGCRSAWLPARDARARVPDQGRAPEQIDLHRFERWTRDALESLSHGDAEAAATGFRGALESWRGPALADLADEPFAAVAVARPEELRLAALKHRIEAELALGRIPSW